MAPPPINMGLQLFPPPPTAKKQSKFSTRRGRIQDELQSQSSRTQTPPPTDGIHSPMSASQTAINSHGRSSPAPHHSGPVPVAEIPRSQSAFSETPTLVRSHSNSSHTSSRPPPPLKTTFTLPQNRSVSSPLQNPAGPSRQGSADEPMIRSIFPRYNPDLPLDRQSYYPHNAPSTNSAIPQSAISRDPYSPVGNGRVPSVRSPLSAPPTQTSFPPGVLNVRGGNAGGGPGPRTPEVSGREELKQLWKVTNGWRVSASEGRTFTLQTKSEVDCPVHTLSSREGDTFYKIRLDPTSTSANLTMTRQDPNKATASSSLPLGSSILGVGGKKKDEGLEVLTTALEEEARKHSPNDGLVALLCPAAAASVALKMAREAQSEEGLRAAADFEVGRLVWDDDTSKYYLTHPSLTAPFHVDINSSPAWSRVEYALEHPLIPRNLVKLVRDGSGGGWLEIDTGVAGRIESYYLVDVAVCAILIVAIQHEKAHNIERFEAPPVLKASPRGSITESFKLSSVAGMGKKDKVRMEETEIDLESQSSIGKGKEEGAIKKEMTGGLRVIYWIGKSIFWIIKALVKCIAGCIICVSRCLTRKGLN